MCLKLYIHSLEDVTAPSGQRNVTAEVKILAMLWFNLVLDQRGEAECFVSISAFLYKSISCSLTLWRRYSSYSFFWRGNNSVKHTNTRFFIATATTVTLSTFLVLTTSWTYSSFSCSCLFCLPDRVGLVLQRNERKCLRVLELLQL